jgi:hypothetical protein
VPYAVCPRPFKEGAQEQIVQSTEAKEQSRRTQVNQQIIKMRTTKLKIGSLELSRRTEAEANSELPILLRKLFQVVNCGCIPLLFVTSRGCNLVSE